MKIYTIHFRSKIITPGRRWNNYNEAYTSASKADKAIERLKEINPNTEWLIEELELIDTI